MKRKIAIDLTKEQMVGVIVDMEDTIPNVRKLLHTAYLPLFKDYPTVSNVFVKEVDDTILPMLEKAVKDAYIANFSEKELCDIFKWLSSASYIARKEKSVVIEKSIMDAMSKVKEDLETRAQVLMIDALNADIDGTSRLP